MIKKNIISILLYAFAILMAFYAIWSLVRTGSLVSAAVNMGQITYAGSAYDIFSVYMVNGIQFLVYAALLAAAGYILQKIQPLVGDCCTDEKAKKDLKKELAILEEEIEEFEEEIDDFFSRGESKEADEKADEKAKED